eukprot:scaffold123775_cov69-Phaeocystis_antarctica.AAC.1
MDRSIDRQTDMERQIVDRQIDTQLSISRDLRRGGRPREAELTGDLRRGGLDPLRPVVVVVVSTMRVPTSHRVTVQRASRAARDYPILYSTLLCSTLLYSTLLYSTCASCALRCTRRSRCDLERVRSTW